MKQALILFSLVALASCSMQKRRYQKGVYVNWHRSSGHTLSRASEPRPHPHHARENAITEIAQEPTKPVEEPVVASADAALKINHARPSLLIRHSKADPDSCDRILLRNGEEREGKVLEISSGLVKYRKCAPGSDVVYSIARSEVMRIWYANGTQEVINAPVARQQTTLTPKEHPDAIIVYVLTATGWIIGIGSIPAIIIGSRVLREMKANPGKYTDEGAIKACVIASWIKVALLILVVILVLAVVASLA